MVGILEKINVKIGIDEDELLIEFIEIVYHRMTTWHKHFEIKVRQPIKRLSTSRNKPEYYGIHS